MIVDLRSDTVTKPTAEMLEAMFAAEVGDDVFGEDVSINKLEQSCADMFHMQSGLFCPSGTMTNQIAIKCHSQPGDEIICDENAHVYQYEGGGIAFNSGASVKLLHGDRGRITANQVAAAINPDDVHRANSSLVCLENTCNRGGGSCYDFEEIKKIKTVCSANELALHLDGARLWNALIVKNETAEQYGNLFDSISICFSKGLGSPVGSVLLGSHNFIAKARRIRKVFGGGMRQAGYLAAACSYALENNIQRLSQDHEHAKVLANALATKDFVKQILPVETNILIFELHDNSAAAYVVKLKEKGILAYAIAQNRIRWVLHLNITSKMIDYSLNIIKTI